ncbi:MULTISPECIES: NAD(P)-dependent alcohol dehydrogenase [Halocynthiibacter]|uniref:NAD(P)-dependent alcohol dehydrogenase n=1 Tax=Halocynthiibacter halioticoli TaxID=2986804 RepID=A0AAE3J2J5_9RHOB|nr:MULTISPECIES: NAD(P)-dependent alcohol dehydrogenase [Halocynthiibacter]MCV6825076.1 NAD(P)-dependent alcohol dehydrogenase [Halocynthiibacter halioticoli]MCW4058077.1 NAD(P)-dependent alcohol dehydrogenase [Halocynthiibacter sp. SDUM655004]
MKINRNAWRIQKYGGPAVLTPFQDVLSQPGPEEIVIQTKASAVTRADTMLREGTPKFARLFLGLRKPRNDLVGAGFSGEVIAVGREVSRFAVGDEVFGEAGLQFGANASHILMNENGVIMPKPRELSHEEAAVMCDGPLTSYNFLHRIAAVRRNARVLILGGSGSLGSAAVQIAAHMGAEVSATTSARNAGLVASLGAGHVIDYSQEDFTMGADTYDVIFDTLGVSSFGQAKRVLTPNGRYICPVLGCDLLGASLVTSVFGRKRAQFSATGMLKPAELREQLSQVLEIVEARALAPVIDRTYPLNALPEAHRYVDTGRKVGNVVAA